MSPKKIMYYRNQKQRELTNLVREIHSLRKEKFDIKILLEKVKSWETGIFNKSPTMEEYTRKIQEKRTQLTNEINLLHEKAKKEKRGARSKQTILHEIEAPYSECRKRLESIKEYCCVQKMALEFNRITKGVADLTLSTTELSNEDIEKIQKLEDEFSILCENVKKKMWDIQEYFQVSTEEELILLTKTPFGLVKRHILLHGTNDFKEKLHGRNTMFTYIKDNNTSVI